MYLKRLRDTIIIGSEYGQLIYNYRTKLFMTYIKAPISMPNKYYEMKTILLIKDEITQEHYYEFGDLHANGFVANKQKITKEVYNTYMTEYAVKGLVLVRPLTNKYTQYILVNLEGDTV